MTPPILVVEDARSDRMRFQFLLKEYQTSYQFAWKWATGQRPSVMRWFEALAAAQGDGASEKGEERLKDILREPGALKQLQDFKLIILDLAWSNTAQHTMQTLLGISRRDGQELAEARDKGKCDEILHDVEGISLLEEFRLAKKSGPSVRLPEVWIASAYVPAMAMGVREFIWTRYGRAVRLFHKWIDERAFQKGIETRLAMWEKTSKKGVSE